MGYQEGTFFFSLRRRSSSTSLPSDTMNPPSVSSSVSQFNASRSSLRAWDSFSTQGWFQTYTVTVILDRDLCICLDTNIASFPGFL